MSSSNSKHPEMSREDAEYLLGLVSFAVRKRVNAEDFAGEVLLYFCRSWESQPALRAAVIARNNSLVVRIASQAAEKAAKTLLDPLRGGGSPALNFESNEKSNEVISGWEEWTERDLVELGKFLDEPSEEIPAQHREAAVLLRDAVISSRGQSVELIRAFVEAEGDRTMAAEIAGMERRLFGQWLKFFLLRINRYASRPVWARVVS